MSTENRVIFAFLFLNLFIILCMCFAYVCMYIRVCVCMYIYMYVCEPHTCPQRPEEGFRTGTGVTIGCEIPGRYWEPILHLLQERQSSLLNLLSRPIFVFLGANVDVCIQYTFLHKLHGKGLHYRVINKLLKELLAQNARRPSE